MNWVDREKFLHNALQIMAQDGLIIIYDFWITDKMVANSAYTDWYQNEYLKKFPKPPRNEDTWTQSDLSEAFLMEKQTVYEMPYSFSLEGFRKNS